MNTAKGTSCGPTLGAGLTEGVYPSRLPVASKHYSHVYASKKNSSTRTRAAFMSSLDADLARNQRAKRNARRRLNKKLRSIHQKYVTVEIPPTTHTFSVRDVEEKVLVFDGGRYVSTLLPDPSPDNTFTPYKVHDSMYIPDSAPEFGLILPHKNDATGPPIFLRPPRCETLKFTGLHSIDASNFLWSSFLSALFHTDVSNKRGKARRTFSQSKVANLGSQACLNQPGVRQDSYHKSKMSASHWDNVIHHIRSSESLFNHVMHPDAIRHTMEAHKAVGYKLMLPSSGQEKEGTTIFSAMNISQDAYLRAHTDNDFTYATISAHLPDHHYSLHDEIIAYFCFPTLGVAVPIRPGDQLIFSSQIPHCISSRCNPDKTVISTSMYLKDAVVGLNDNTMELTPQQQRLAGQYDQK